MALVAVLDLTDRGTWWSWHLASMLARRDFEVTWVEAAGAARTAGLLGRLPAQAWRAGEGPGLARLAPDTEPMQLPGRPVALRLLPGVPPDVERPAMLDADLLAWAQTRSDWVIADLGRDGSAYPESLRSADLLVVVTTPEASDLGRLRDVGVSLRGKIPAKRQYAVIDERDRRADRAYLRRRIPAAWRTAWEGGSPAVDLEPMADTVHCVGVAQWAWRQRDDGTPVFDLPPGQVEVPHAVVMRAREDWAEIAARVAAQLGVTDQALPAADEPHPQGVIVRFCVEGGRRPRMEGDFIADPTEDHLIPSAQVPLNEALTGPCVFILGEPGVGKSHASRAFAHRLDLRGHVDIRSELADLLVDAPLEVALDGVDEWTGTPDQLADALAKWHARNPSIPLRIFGRPGDRMATLREKLRAPGDGYPTVTLLPLRRRDVEPLAAELLRAASAPSSQSAGLLHQVERLHVGALAARPITLRMLALLQGKGSLPGDRPELYRRGLGELVLHQGGDAASVLPVARKLAWAAVLGGAHRLGFGVGHDLDLAEAPAYFAGLSRAALDAALKTPIFVQVGRGAWAFSHRSYAEYLAAAFAVEAKVPLGRLRALMEIEGIVPEPLSGLATWLAALRPDCAGWFIEADPARLLELQAHLPEAQRLQWLEALVSAARQGRAQLWGHDLRGLLSSEVDERARQLLNDDHEEVARAAIRLVALADRPGAVDALLEIAVGPSHAEGVRSEAIFRLGDRSDRSSLAALRHLLDQDVPDRLHGQLLEVLWPEHLSAAELILHLDPRRRRERNFNLSFFLGRHVAAIVDGLSPEDLERVLAWTATQPGHLVAERWPFLGALLQRAWDLALQPTIARALGGVFAAWLPSNVDGSDLERWGLDAWEDPSDFRRRRGVVRVILELLGDEQASRRRFWGISRILPPLDIVLEEAEALRDVEPEMARRWCGLALDYRWSSDSLPRLEALAELLPALREEIELRRSWETRPLPVPVAREPGEPESTIEQQVDELIEAAGHDSMWWVEIAWRLDVLRHRDELDPQLEASTTPVAEAFLATPPLDEPAWLGDSRLPSAARHAWRLCDPGSLPTDPPVIRFWLAAFLLAGDRSHADGLIVAAVEAFSTEVEAAAELALTHGRGLSWTVFTWLSPWWAPRWSERAQELLARSLPREPCEESPSTDDERRRANELRNRRDGLLHDQERLFRALLALPSARDEFWAWGMARLDRDGVVSALFRADTARAWGDLWDRFVEEADTRRLITFALGDSMELWDLAPHQSAQANRLLRQDFGDPEPRRDVGPVRPIDRVARLRSALFARLVASGAVEQVTALVEEFGWHGGNILDAQRARAKSAWQPLSLAEAASFEPRLRTPKDLLDRVLEALDAVERDLADAGLAEAFLDRSHARTDKKTAKPKQETIACSLLADRLRGKLGNLAGVHLEPQEDGGHDRIDIKLDTLGEGGDALTLKIEVKWVTNDRVKTAMESQLVNRYVNHSEEIAAIYLVLWPAPRLRVPKVPADWRDDPADLEALLETQAAELRRRHPCLAARVLRLGQRRSG